MSELHKKVISGVNRPFFIHHLASDNTVKTIYSFGITEQAKSNFFTKEQLAKYKANGTRMLFFPNFRIYSNDTVNDLKRKVITYLEKVKLSYAFNDMYFFYKADVQYTIQELYAQFVEVSKTKHTIKHSILNAFYWNANGEEGSKYMEFLGKVEPAFLEVAKKKEAFFELEELDATHTYPEEYLHRLAEVLCKSHVGDGDKRIYTFEANHPLGVFVDRHDMNPIRNRIVNPYNVRNSHDILLLQRVLNSVYTDSEQCLLEFPHFNAQNIYMCTFDDCTTKPLYNSPDFIQVYFPYLYKSEVTSFKDYKRESNVLYKETLQNFCTPQAMERIKRIQAIHQIGHLNLKAISTGSKKILSEGLLGIQFNIYPTKGIQYNIPMRHLFQQLKTHQNMPFIKYISNEKIQALVKLAIVGYGINNIPVPRLPENTINNEIKLYNKQNTITTYGRLDNFEIRTVISHTGILWIRATFFKHTSIEDCEALIREYITKHLLSVFEYNTNIIDKHMFQFSTINAVNIGELNMNYDWLYENNANNYNAIALAISAMSDIFTKNVISQKDEYNYKRVSNYDEVDQIDAVLISLINDGHYNHDEIIEKVTKMFDADEEKIRGKFNDKIELIQTNANKSLRIKKSAGFKTFLLNEQSNGLFGFQVEGITHTEHLQFIEYYLNCIIGAAYEPDVMNELTRYIVKKKVKKEVVPEEITDVYSTIKQKTEFVIDPENYDDFSHLLSNEEEDGTEETTTSKSNADSLFSEEDIFSGGCLTCEVADGGLFVGGGVGVFLGGNQRGGYNEFLWEVQEGFRGGGPKKDPRNLNNEFLKRLQRADPEVFNKMLIVKKDPEKKDSKLEERTYASACPWQSNRQPLVLTDAQKAKIDAEHPNSYQETYKYRNHWYICPRYWSTELKVPLNEEQARSGEFGSIIPKEGNIPKDAKIYDLGQNKYWIDPKTQKVNWLNPNFVKPDNYPHPDNLCMPCCVKKTNTDKAIRVRKMCLEGKHEEDDEKNVRYILKENRVFLNKGRYAFPPKEVVEFLKSGCRPKKHKECLLRYGMENENSFLACIAYYYSNREYSAKGFVVDVLVPSVTLDTFVKAQNGNLIQVFAPLTTVFQKDTDVYSADCLELISRYKKTTTYQNLMQKDTLENRRVLYRMCLAYEEFIRQLVNAVSSGKEVKGDIFKPSQPITYKYLWDIICTPNPALFPAGLNLLIIDYIQKDVEDFNNNIRIVCPSNHFANVLYDPSRPTAFLLKVTNKEYYQPMLLVTLKRTTPNIVPEDAETTRIFDNEHWFSKMTLNPLLERIEKECRPLKSVTSYMFERNYSASYIHQILTKNMFRVSAQYVNHNGMVVGLGVKSDKIQRYVPTYPSDVIADLPTYALNFEKMADLWTTLSETISWLKLVKSKTDSILKTTPKFVVVNKGFVMGVITETNDFVPLKEQEIEIDSGLPKINGYNFTELDSRLLWEKDTNEVEIDFLRRVNLETKFYRLFKNILKNEINRSIERREELRELISSGVSIDEPEEYETKRDAVIELLRKISMPHISFSDYDAASVHRLVLDSNCNQEKEDCERSVHCRYRNGKCVFIIPRLNFTNHTDNSVNYFVRLADELLRYDNNDFLRKSINVEFFNTQNISRNEVIIPVNVIQNGYFYGNNLVSTIEQYYKMPHDMQTPYLNDSQTENVKHKEYVLITKEVTSTYITQLLQQIKGIEVVFDQTHHVSYPYATPDYIMKLHSNLVNHEYGKNAKEYLNSVVGNIIDEDAINALRIYYHEGKHNLVTKIEEQGSMTVNKSIGTSKSQTILERLINFPEYYVTFLDVLFIMLKMDISVVAYTPTFNPNLSGICGKCDQCVSKKQKMFCVESPTNEKVVILKIPTNYPNVNRPYEMRILHLNNTNKCIYSKQELPLNFKKDYQEHTFKSIYDYLSIYGKNTDGVSIVEESSVSAKEDVQGDEEGTSVDSKENEEKEESTSVDSSEGTSVDSSEGSSEGSSKGSKKGGRKKQIIIV